MGVYFNPPPPPPNKKRGDMGTKLSVKIDGREVKLEDAFEVFEDLFDDDIEKVFDHMETTFRHIDNNIKEKVNRLKIKLATEKPDKYSFIPDNERERLQVKEAMERAHLEEIKEFHLNSRQKRAIRNLIVMGLMVFTALISIVFGIMMGSDKKVESKPATVIEQPTTTGNSNSL